MLAAAANATATPAPARLHRFTKVTLGVPFADSARDSDVAGFRMVAGLLNGSGWRMIQRAVRRRNLVTSFLG
jgi:hypothetical protein